jgi:uncharacterized membrane protein required for colicin V production
MYLDIGLGVLMLLFMFLGWRKGFLCGILGFLAGVVALVAAIFAARPLNDLVHISGKYGVLICGVAIYVFIRLVFWIIMRFIKRAKKKNKKIDRADRIGGIFLGLAEYAVFVVGIFIFFYLLSVVPWVGKSVEWLLDKSYVGKPIFTFVVKHVIPFLGEVTTSVVGRLL